MMSLTSKPVAASTDETDRSQQLRDRVMHQLSRLDRLIIVLYYYEQLSTHEVAMLVNLSEAQVDNRRIALADQLQAMVEECRQPVFCP